MTMEPKTPTLSFPREMIGLPICISLDTAIQAPNQGISTPIYRLQRDAGCTSTQLARISLDQERAADAGPQPAVCTYLPFLVRARISKACTGLCTGTEDCMYSVHLHHTCLSQLTVPSSSWPTPHP
jgi:hypothetical protein